MTVKRRNGIFTPGGIKILLCSFAFLLLLPAGALRHAGAADNFLPAWHTGDTWLVKAVYPLPLKEGEWSAPVLWEYRVAGCRDGCYILDINDMKGLLKLSARLFYRQDNHSLARAEITRTRHGKPVVRVLTYDRGAPIRTEHTLTPCDTPVFPLLLPSSTDYVVTRRIDEELKIRETVRQEVRRVRGIEEQELPDLPGERDLIEVRCLSKDGTLIFVQYWDENLPWPVYGRNRNMKYRLVEE